MSNQQWSDDEEDNSIEEQPERLFPPSDSESEEDYSELNAMIIKKIENKKEIYTFNENVIKKKQKKKENKPVKESKNNKISWSKLIIKEDDKKEKKWVSKRMNKLKEKEGKILKSRQFNPRLPIPNKKIIKKQSKIINTTNINEFPEL